MDVMMCEFLFDIAAFQTYSCDLILSYTRMEVFDVKRYKMLDEKDVRCLIALTLTQMADQWQQ
jgi:hypothetical protein